MNFIDSIHLFSLQTLNFLLKLLQALNSMCYKKYSIASFHFFAMIVELHFIRNFYDCRKPAIDFIIFLSISYLIIECFFLSIILNLQPLFIVLNYCHLILLFFKVHFHFSSFFIITDFVFQKDQELCFGFLKQIHLLFFLNLLLRNVCSVNLNYWINSFLHASVRPILNQFYLRRRTSLFELKVIIEIINDMYLQQYFAANIALNLFVAIISFLPQQAILYSQEVVMSFLEQELNYSKNLHFLIKKIILFEVKHSLQNLGLSTILMKLFVEIMYDAN